MPHDIKLEWTIAGRRGARAAWAAGATRCRWCPRRPRARRPQRASVWAWAGVEAAAVSATYRSPSPVTATTACSSTRATRARAGLCRARAPADRCSTAAATRPRHASIRTLASSEYATLNLRSLMILDLYRSTLVHTRKTKIILNLHCQVYCTVMMTLLRHQLYCYLPRNRFRLIQLRLVL